MAWYRDVLSLEMEFHDEPNRFALFRCGAIRLAVKAGHPRDDARDSVNLVFEVDDVDAMRSLLCARGASPDEPFDSPLNEGYREMRMTDPEGTQIRLFCWTNR
jgi:hypothetical protein